MKSTMGRPRKVTDEQIIIILKWHQAVSALRAQLRSLGSQRTLARRLGIAHSVVSSIIERKGVYKTAAPADRARELAARRERMEKKSR